MIFLSHNSKDKTIVEPFANRLAEVFGMNNVFYDSWSIQPGDGIIDKMEEGLKRWGLIDYQPAQPRTIRLQGYKLVKE